MSDLQKTDADASLIERLRNLMSKTPLSDRNEAADRLESLVAELETERCRLACCGVAALGYFEGCKDEYRSASLEDTLRLYEQNKTLKAENERFGSAVLQIRKALTGDIHGNENLLDVITTLKAELAEARKNEVDALEKSLAKNGVIHSLKEEIAEWNRAYNTQTHQIAALKAQSEPVQNAVMGSIQGKLMQFEAERIAAQFTGRGVIYTTPQPNPDARDTERLEWLMRNVSGSEFRRLGVTYGGNCGRDRIDAAMEGK